MKLTSPSNIQIIGWRETIGLPSLNIKRLKVKVDTGARTSALHADQIEEFSKKRMPWVRFRIPTTKKLGGNAVHAEAPLIEKRIITDSHGKKSLRPVIVVEILLAGQRWVSEVTLIDRSDMAFRMLLGRQAIAHRFVVDPGRSYVMGNK